jgi:hypothetical protein
MPGQATFKVAPVVKALRIVLFTLLVLYGMIVVSCLVFMARFFPSLANLPSGLTFLGTISFLFDGVLPGVIYFFIAYSIFKLISLISRGEPFSPASPRYIRRIGYAVLCLAAINAVVNAISAFTPPVNFGSKAFIWSLLSGLSTLLVGFGFLVIAKVLEAGVRLQQDQNLTV